MASFKCCVISSLGHLKALSGTVTVAPCTPVANPGTGVADVPGVTAITPCAVHVQLRTVELPDTVNSTLDDCAATCAACSSAKRARRRHESARRAHSPKP